MLVICIINQFKVIDYLVNIDLKMKMTMMMKMTMWIHLNQAHILDQRSCSMIMMLVAVDHPLMILLLHLLLQYHYRSLILILEKEEGGHLECQQSYHCHPHHPCLMDHWK